MSEGIETTAEPPSPAKKVAKKKKLTKKTAKPAAKKKKKAASPAKKVAKKKPAKKAAKKVVKPKVRTERLDMRITKEDKRKLEALAKKQRRTVTSVALEAIEKFKG